MYPEDKSEALRTAIQKMSCEQMVSKDCWVGQAVPPLSVAALPNAINRLEQAMANLWKNIESIEELLQIKTPIEPENNESTKAAYPSKLQDRTVRIAIVADLVEACCEKLHGIDVHLQDL